MSVLIEGSSSLDDGGGAGKTFENGSDISTWLHGDNAELILFVDPDEESLGIVVEDTSASGPVAVQAASFEESISLLEKEVIVDELGLDLFGHTVKGVEGTLKIAFKGGASLNNSLHDLVALLVGDTGAERVSSNIPSDSNSGRLDESGLFFSEGRAV